MMAVLFCTIATFTLSQAVMAQSEGMGRPDPEAMAAARANQLRKDLKKAELPLTDEQDKKVNDLYQETAKKMQALFQESAGDRDAIRSKMQPIREEQDKKLKEILSAAQWDYYEKNLKGKRTGGPGGN